MELNVDGIADMRSGGSVLEVPQAPMRGHSPASIVRVPVVRNCAASIVRKPAVQNLREHRPRTAYTNCLHTQKRLSGISESLFLYVLKLAKLNLDGIAAMRSGGSVLEAPPGAEEGALPREHRPRAGCTERYREREPVRRYW